MCLKTIFQIMLAATHSNMYVYIFFLNIHIHPLLKIRCDSIIFLLFGVHVHVVVLFRYTFEQFCSSSHSRFSHIISHYHTRQYIPIYHITFVIYLFKTSFYWTPSMAGETSTLPQKIRSHQKSTYIRRVNVYIHACICVYILNFIKMFNFILTLAL